MDGKILIRPGNRSYASFREAALFVKPVVDFNTGSNFVH